MGDGRTDAGARVAKPGCASTTASTPPRREPPRATSQEQQRGDRRAAERPCRSSSSASATSWAIGGSASCHRSARGCTRRGRWRSRRGSRPERAEPSRRSGATTGSCCASPDADALPPARALLPDPDEVEELVVARLAGSALFAGQFRENAARALLLPRRRPGARTPLWVQRLRRQASSRWRAASRRFRSCSRPTARASRTSSTCRRWRNSCAAIARRRDRGARGRDARPRPSRARSRSRTSPPTSTRATRPLAERRAQALVLDRGMLRDLLGPEALRELLDASAIDATQRELQSLVPGQRARGPDALHELLRRLGDSLDRGGRRRAARRRRRKRRAGSPRSRPSGARCK